MGNQAMNHEHEQKKKKKKKLKADIGMVGGFCWCELLELFMYCFKQVVENLETVPCLG